MFILGFKDTAEVFSNWTGTVSIFFSFDGHALQKKKCVKIISWIIPFRNVYLLLHIKQKFIDRSKICEKQILFVMQWILGEPLTNCVRR